MNLIMRLKLLLPEDQVKRAYNGSEYDFTDVFEFAKPYISSSDFAIGVFEGPLAGEDAVYSTSNFDDDKELYLNFPDSFAGAVNENLKNILTTSVQDKYLLDHIHPNSSAGVMLYSEAVLNEK